MHSKFGTFQVPNEFLNTNKKVPAAVAPKQAVRKVRYKGLHMRRATRATRLYITRSYLIGYTHASTLVSSCTLAPMSWW